jgi:hypothetical protein
MQAPQQEAFHQHADERNGETAEQGREERLPVLWTTIKPIYPPQR